MDGIETRTEPPETEHDDDGDDPSTRISVTLLGVEDAMHEATMQLFGSTADDPARFADALLRCGLALAALRGPDYEWAARKRFGEFGT